MQARKPVDFWEAVIRDWWLVASQYGSLTGSIAAAGRLLLISHFPGISGGFHKETKWQKRRRS